MEGTLNIISAWKKQKETLQEKCRKLTDADLEIEKDRENAMVEKLALKLGLTPGQIRNIITPAPQV